MEGKFIYSASSSSSSSSLCKKSIARKLACNWERRSTGAGRLSSPNSLTYDILWLLVFDAFFLRDGFGFVVAADVVGLLLVDEAGGIGGVLFALVVVTEAVAVEGEPVAVEAAADEEEEVHPNNPWKRLVAKLLLVFVVTVVEEFLSVVTLLFSDD